jgi:hypothetical protein
MSEGVAVANDGGTANARSADYIVGVPVTTNR